MTRRVFFSFHYQRDIFRVNIVRNSWVIPGHEEAGFWDASLWEKVKREGDFAIRNMIENGLQNTSVTVVLIGAETYQRRWVLYELERSWARGNGILGVYINNIPFNNRYDSPGPNPLERLAGEWGGRSVFYSQIYNTYDWHWDDGYNNFSKWIEQAYQRAQQRPPRFRF